MSHLGYKQLKQRYEDFEIPFGEELEAYNQLVAFGDDLKRKIQEVVLKPRHVQPFFQAGRLFRVSFGDCWVMESDAESRGSEY